LPKEIDGGNNAIIEVMIDDFVDSLPRVVHKDHNMYDFFIDFDWRTLWINLIEQLEDVRLQEFLLMEGHWIGRIVVPCHEVVFEGCIDQ
jgi:hypothetical protein